MFRSARLTLTAWYLLIIMVISLLFSSATYHRINAELVHLEEINEHVVERQRRFLRYLPPEMQPESLQPRFDPEAIHDARVRLITALVILNAAVFFIAGGGGYFLAGRTLRPIQEMLDEQKRFLTDASHELRTPLTALRSEIEVALRDKSLSLTDAKLLLRSNLEEVIHLQNLSDGLITLTNRGRQRGEAFSEVTLQGIILAALKKIHPLAKKKHIIVEQQVADMSITGQKVSLTELFVILLDNAIKYSPEKSRISLKSNHTKNTAIITISDQGIGIKKTDLPHIFDRFYRADSARSKSDMPGYGLGLSIAQKIIEEHYGKISVVSTVGKGSTFTVRLPKEH